MRPERAGGMFLKGSRVLLWAALFCLAIRSLWSAQPEIPCVFTDIDRIEAVGDLHGDYQNFIKILIRTHVVDSGLHWIAGRTHFVQTGDILDRGRSARKIFDLLIRLEKEAEAAGGKVHVLIGNHEEMAMAGISLDYPGFVTVEQFLSFLPDEMIDKKTSELTAKKAAGLPPGTDPPSISLDEFLAYFQEVMDKDEDAREEYYRNLRELYGPWILSHNIVIKINDVVFAHGGISESYSREPLEKLNSEYRSELGLVSRKAPIRTRIVYRPAGPLWYRDLAQADEKCMSADVDRILAHLGANHMVFGHSPHVTGESEMLERFDGKVWIIDTGISESFGGHLSALVIENRTFEPWGVSHGTN